jgi:superoxide dismutase, Fe-Mn family
VNAGAGVAREAPAAVPRTAPEVHCLPALPYGFAALEPHIDRATLEVHHGQHHAAYVAGLNKALEHFPDLQQRTPQWLLLNRHKIPKMIRKAVQFHAGGHLNHSLYWRSMSPAGGGALPSELAAAINLEFGSVGLFQKRFEQAGAALLGAGWVWLVVSQKKGGRLEVMTTAAHDNPLTGKRFPLLVNDAWEHAYYLKHQNRRADYLGSWWRVVDWTEAARRYALSANPWASSVF